ncbi:hypothetical protein GOODEAATRI_004923 [Goodea atripinnis]|uniref:Uncharacterized protein n=1 Tax=Goodea atripinnis TaxID=208336 RepID=A0ABV0NRY4_9TELE
MTKLSHSVTMPAPICQKSHQTRKVRSRTGGAVQREPSQPCLADKYSSEQIDKEKSKRQQNESLKITYERCKVEKWTDQVTDKRQLTSFHYAASSADLSDC